MRVFVKNLRGQALMPCSPCKARKLLKNKKANFILKVGISFKKRDKLP